MVQILGPGYPRLTEIRALLLAAGLGTRLRPYTEKLPKCLMPISRRPLLEHWLCTLYKHNVSKVLVNTHHHSKMVREFLTRKPFQCWVDEVYEQELFGTAGTLWNNWQYFAGSTTLLIHSDNWCQCDFGRFVQYHMFERPAHTLMTMMTFETEFPEACGIVESDKYGVVTAFYEKPVRPKSNLANAAVYILEPELINILAAGPQVVDFSSEVIPKYLGRIATWENRGIHRVIGIIDSLINAQLDATPDNCWPMEDDWLINYRRSAVVREIDSMAV